MSRSRSKKAVPYRSKLEKRLADELRRRGVRFKYEATTYDVDTDLGKNRIECADCGGKNIIQHRTYTPDFFLDNGVVIEAKGRFTQDNRRLIGYFVEQHPDVDFRMVFDKDNTLTKASKTRYSEWCAKKGIPCAIGGIPESWTQ